MRDESTGTDRLEGTEIDNVNADRIINILIDEGKSIGVAESVTAGGIANTLTSVAGSSKVFPGGIVCYSRSVKEKLLSVPASILDEQGTVSADVALALAIGAQKVFDVDIGFGITGNAGPATDSDQSAVGEVHMALISRDGEKIEKSRELFGEREIIRGKAITEALRMIREFVLHKYVHGGK